VVGASPNGGLVDGQSALFALDEVTDRCARTAMRVALAPNGVAGRARGKTIELLREIVTSTRRRAALLSRCPPTVVPRGTCGLLVECERRTLGSRRLPVWSLATLGHVSDCERREYAGVQTVDGDGRRGAPAHPSTRRWFPRAWPRLVRQCHLGDEPRASDRVATGQDHPHHRRQARDRDRHRSVPQRRLSLPGEQGGWNLLDLQFRNPTATYTDLESAAHAAHVYVGERERAMREK
jgi:hypothetical protein